MKKTLLLLTFLAFTIGVKAQTTAVDTLKEHQLVFTAVEVSPEFPGGEAAFGKFLQINIRYPAEDHKNKVQGKVYVQFVVERDGSLTDMKILRSPSETMSAETIRVLQLSPKWHPGIQHGKPVRVQYTVPINFSLG